MEKDTEKFIREEVAAGDKYIKAAYDLGVSDSNKKLSEFVSQYCKEIESEQITEIKHCNCKNEEKHGETAIMCCNNCGLPTEKFWK